jgi:hypothetical protein
MSTSARPKPTLRRALLERLARPLLARFLATHAADFCAAHALSLDALASSDPRDRTLIYRFYDLLHADDPPASPPFPEAALGHLAVLEALGTLRGGERLIEVDVARVLPRATHGDEDLALTAILDHPELALRAHALLPTESPDTIDGFTEYDPADSRALRFGQAERIALETLVGIDLDALGRTDYCAVHVTRESKRLLLEFEYCRRAKTRAKLDLAARAVAPSTDVNTERAYAEMDRANGRLALHAPHPAMKEILRKAIGKVTTGNPDHFTAARVYDLSPFRDLPSALTPHGERLLAVAIHRLTVRTPAESEVDLSRARRDIRHDAHVESLLEIVTKIGAPVAVRLYLTILGRRAPLKVELSAKQGRNRLHFNRTDPELVEVVRVYFVARGILREIAPSDSSELAATA